MAYIKTGVNQPGIIELLFYKGSSGKALSNLAQTLLLGPSGLSSGERELIAAYVSKLNDCNFCHDSHVAAANCHLNDNGNIITGIIENLDEANISDKLKALLKIAKKVQSSGKLVQKEDVENAIKNGATEEDVHDTVLIAAAFCMFNRYVDGLGTKVAEEKEYKDMGIRMSKGYKYPPLFLRKYVVKKLNKEKSK